MRQDAHIDGGHRCGEFDVRTVGGVKTRVAASVRTEIR